MHVPQQHLFKITMKACYAGAMKSGASLILTSVEHKNDAISLARQLVELKLAACVQISDPGISIYCWQGQLEESREYYLNIKATPSQSAAVIKWLEQHHPYDTPEILCLEAAASSDYLQWMRATTS